MSQFLKPGLTENQVAAFGFEYLYSFPGVEDVEDVIVSSGPNAWPNWRNFSDRIIRPGELRDHRRRRADVERLQVLRVPDVLRRREADGRDEAATTTPRSRGCATRSTRSSPGATTADIASKWPSAKEAWGYEDEDEAAANLWGHGLGLAQYDQPVISRIWSLDHPVEIQPGMVFALETQHGKVHDFGVRLEEMLVVTETGHELITSFPIDEITVVE